MDVDSDDEEAELQRQEKEHRRAQVKALEQKLAKVRRARKDLTDSEDLDAVQELVDMHAKAEEDLASKLRQARGLYQELRPAELKLEQAKRDKDQTQQKLEKTKAELAKVEEAIRKAKVQQDRLVQQQELQEAKLARLDTAIKEHHAAIGKSGGDGDKASPPSTPPAMSADFSTHPDFVHMQQQIKALTEALQAASAASGCSGKRAGEEAGANMPPAKRTGASAGQEAGEW
jgi:DNA repair exonuclease SbcCD ATPase subunit